ncbi:MAG TPA: hypothetical protein VGY56_15375 [Verrucomicrobiae bacterium]|nr:hypothetical protein [Verrucomicrobiae bacterium]
MKWHAHIIWSLVVGAAGPLVAAQADTNAPVKSVFILPSNPNEGRDPFFPNSMRPYEDAAPRQQQRSVDLTTLQIKGYSEIAGHRYVIINNHTFGEGDEGEVLTPGGRVHIRCLAVSAESVMVEANGARQLLKFSDQP